MHGNANRAPRSGISGHTLIVFGALRHIFVGISVLSVDAAQPRPLGVKFACPELPRSAAACGAEIHGASAFLHSGSVIILGAGVGQWLWQQLAQPKCAFRG